MLCKSTPLSPVGFNVSHPEITQLVPHRRPMLLVDEVVAREGTKVVCRTTLREDTLFVKDGQAPLLLAIELFAQSAAVLTSILAIKTGVAINAGALLGTREIVFEGDALRAGDVLDIHVEQTMAMGMMAHVDCALFRDGVRLAHGSVQVMAGEPR